MKIISIAILTFSAVCTFAQEPYSGTYFTSKKDRGFESDIFQFHGDGTFTYVFFTCTGTGLGNGNYEVIAGDSLRLQFTDCLTCEDIQQVETVTDSSDSLEVSLNIQEWSGGGDLPGVNVYFPSERIGTVTNEDGYAKLTTNRSDESRTLQISFIGYDPVYLEVPADATLIKGKIYLTWHWIYDSSDTKTYKVLKWTKSRLKLRRYPELAISYDKVKPKKANELIENRLGEAGYKLYNEKIKMQVNK